MSDETPTLPKAGRPSESEIDERATELDERAQELTRREAALMTAEANAVAEFEATNRQLQDAQALASHPPRQSTNEGARENPQAIRKDMGRSRQLDADVYLEIHPDKQLLWINDLQGDVQRWIDAGASPVPVTNRTGRVFEGITDKVESKWVRAIGGSDGMGGHFWVYLLMIDPDIYHQIKIQPERDRQELIRRAMMAGGDRSESDAVGPKLPTYKANLPTGQTGIDITRETVS